MSEGLLVGWCRGDVSAALVARVAAVVALVGSAAVHATVIGEHLDEWPLAGAFFVLVTLVELVLAVAVVVAWSPLTALAVVAASTGTVAVWLVSRTAGLPFGPAELRAAEAVGVPDLACCALELAAAALVAPWVVRRGSQQPRAPGSLDRAGVAAASALAGALVAVALWGLAASLGGTGAAEHGHDEAPESLGAPAVRGTPR